jgi:hypothetical protein
MPAQVEHPARVWAPTSLRPTWCEIDPRRAVAHNTRELRRLVGKGVAIRRMPRTPRRKQHVTDAACPRIGAAWVPNTPKADHV